MNKLPREQQTTTVASKKLECSDGDNETSLECADAPLDLVANSDQSSEPHKLSILQVEANSDGERRFREMTRGRTAQFETLCNEDPLGVYLVDDNFRICEMNPFALAAFGGDIPDLIGRDFDEVIHLLWPRGYADEIVRLFWHTLETGDSYSTAERIEQRLNQGMTEYYAWQINRITLAADRHGVVCYFREASARTMAEEKIGEDP